MIAPSSRATEFIAAFLLAQFLAGDGVLAQDAEHLSLADALAYALNHNPRIAAAASRVQGTRADVALAKSSAEPELSLRASGRLQGPLQEFTIPIGPGRTIQINRAFQGTVGVGIVSPLWTGGRVPAATGAARAQVHAAEADFQQATEQLLYEVAVGYYRVLAAHSARAEAQSALTSAAEDYRTAQARRAAGTVTTAAVAGAGAGLRRAQESLAATQSAVSDTEQQFSQLLGRPLNEPVALVDEPVTFEPPTDAEEATSIALATRPELLALAHRQKSAQAAVRVAQAERNPTLATTAEAALQTTTDVLESHAEVVGLEFAWPILNYAAPRARERRARATAKELERTRADLEAVVALQAAESGRRVLDARERVASAQESLAAADAAAREARVARRAGTATSQALAAAESALEQSQARRRQAQHGLSIALLGRARALGLVRGLFLAPAEEAAR